MNDQNPLKLPVGSVRAIIALLLIVAVIIATFLQIPIPDVMYGFIGAIIGFYFAHRANNTENH